MLSRLLVLLLLPASLMLSSCEEAPTKPVAQRDSAPDSDTRAKAKIRGSSASSVAPVLNVELQTETKQEPATGGTQEPAAPAKDPAAGEKPAASGDTPAAEGTQEEAKDAESGEKPAAEEAKPTPIAGAALQMLVPAGWKTVAPASSMIELECSIPGEKEEDTPGRMTGMLAGGSVEQNVERWYGQFQQPDGTETKDVAKLEEAEVAGLKIHTVDISGTYLDGMGPMSPKVERENYRMLASIIEMEDGGSYFIKFYGPKDLVEKQAEAFKAMIQSIRPVD